MTPRRRVSSEESRHIYNGNIDPHRARAVIREICGEIAVKRDESGKFLIARIGLNSALLKEKGSNRNSGNGGAITELYSVDLR